MKKLVLVCLLSFGMIHVAALPEVDCFGSPVSLYFEGSHSALQIADVRPEVDCFGSPVSLYPGHGGFESIVKLWESTPKGRVEVDYDYYGISYPGCRCCCARIDGSSRFSSGGEHCIGITHTIHSHDSRKCVFWMNHEYYTDPLTRREYLTIPSPGLLGLCTACTMGIDPEVVGCLTSFRNVGLTYESPCLQELANQFRINIHAFELCASSFNPSLRWCEEKMVFNCNQPSPDATVTDVYYCGGAGPTTRHATPFLPVNRQHEVKEPYRALYDRMINVGYLSTFSSPILR